MSCPKCSSDDVWDMGTYCECGECGHEWSILTTILGWPLKKLKEMNP
jgi:uncharacterized Zn ribbon protein